MNPSTNTPTREERRQALRGLLHHSGVLERIDPLISPAGRPVEDDVLAEIGRRIANGQLDQPDRKETTR